MFLPTGKGVRPNHCPRSCAPSGEKDEKRQQCKEGTRKTRGEEGEERGKKKRGGVVENSKNDRSD